jgi:hypothetical protein
MAKPIKFTEDELKSIQDLQVNYNQITLAMGQLTISRLGLDTREETLKQALTEASTKENEVAKELTEKYGKGSLNIENGEFTPIPEEVEEITEEKS